MLGKCGGVNALCKLHPAVADIWVIFANFAALSNVNDGQKLDFQHFGRTYQSPKRGGGAYHCRRELFGRHFGRWLGVCPYFATGAD